MTCGDCAHYKPVTVAKRTGRCDHPEGDGHKTYRNSPACSDRFEARKRIRGATEQGRTSRC